MEIDENFIKRLAQEFAEIRVRLAIMRSFAKAAGLSVEDLDQQIDQMLQDDNPQFQRDYELVLEHLLGGD